MDKVKSILVKSVTEALLTLIEVKEALSAPVSGTWTKAKQHSVKDRKGKVTAVTISWRRSTREVCFAKTVSAILGEADKPRQGRANIIARTRRTQNQNLQYQQSWVKLILNQGKGEQVLLVRTPRTQNQNLQTAKPHPSQFLAPNPQT